MLTKEQLTTIEERMEQDFRAAQEEYRKNREALDRVKRFLPTENGNGATGSKSSKDAVLPFVASAPGHVRAVTMIARMEELMRATPNEEWTVPKMLQRLKDEKFDLKGRWPDKTIGLNFSRLFKRDQKIDLVRQGAGRIPNVFRWRPTQ